MNRFLKLSSTILLLLSLLISIIPVSTYAKGVTENELPQQISEIAAKYGLSIVPIDEKVATKHLNDIQELEKYLDKLTKDIKANNSTKHNFNIKADQNYFRSTTNLSKKGRPSRLTTSVISNIFSIFNGSKKSETLYNGVYVAQWQSAPGLLYNVATISYTADYDSHWHFVSINGISSDMGGFGFGVTWHQTGASSNLRTTYYYNDTADIQIAGYYLVGVEIGGFRVGVTYYDMWYLSLLIS